jgi:ABC-type multidrug transport system permease subunit
MHFLWFTALKDVRRHRRNPVEFLIWIGVPLLLGGLIVMATGGKSGPSPQVHLLVADEDDSFISGFLVGALSQEELGGLIRAEEVDQESGREMMDGGKASALLVIPEGFGEAVLTEEPTTLQLWTNPSQRILPGIIEESLSILVDGTFYLQQLLGDQLHVIAEGPPPDLDTFTDTFIAGFSVRINHIIGQFVAYLDPLVIQLEKVVLDDEEEEEQPSYAIYFVPGFLLMSLLFMSQGLGNDLWQERDQRTLRRIVVSPQSVMAFLAGKVVAGTAMMSVVCMVGLSIGYAFFALSPLTLPLAVAWATCTGAMLMALMMLIQLFARSQQAGNILTMILIFPLMMVGGSFFPFEAMPELWAAIGQYTPNGWALQQLKRIILRDFAMGEVAVGFLAMAAVITVLFFIGARRLRGGFAQG